MIPEGHTLEDIKKREQIIRDFYREWKREESISRKFNLSLKEYINFRMVSIVETSEHAAKSYLSTLAALPLSPASRMKKASRVRCLTFAPYAWRRFTPWGVMRCRRGLRTTHYIVLPRLTDYAAKHMQFFSICKTCTYQLQKGVSKWVFHL